MTEESTPAEALDAIYAERHRAISHAGAWGFVTLAVGTAASLLAMQETLEGDLGAKVAVEGFRWMAIGVLSTFGLLLLLAWRHGQGLAGELVFQLDCAMLLLIAGMGVTLSYLASFPRVAVMSELGTIAGILCVGGLFVRIVVSAWGRRIQERSEAEAETIRSSIPRRRPSERVLAAAA